jgi:hypothetical protein
VSQADAWAEGHVLVEQPWVRNVPWPGGQWVFAPLGYRPAAGRQSTAIAPTYSPGLPLLMAAAKRVAGPCAMFWVVPIMGGLLVLSTFGLGRALVSPGTGLLAAAFVLASPVFLFMIMSPMTDVPVAAAWTAALWWLIGSARSATPVRATARVAAAGLAASAAVLIRPNLAAGLLALAVWFPLQWRWAGPRERRRLLLNSAVFVVTASIGVFAVARINQHLYGSALMSGYGAAARLFSLTNVWPNITTYFGWFVESQTAWPLAGVIAFVAPLAWFWPSARDRSGVIVIAALASLILASYLVYDTFDAWWYLRFLLGVWPALMLGFAATLVAVARFGRIGGAAGRVLAVLAVGAFAGWIVWRDVTFAREHSAFRLWIEERRYASVGRLVRASTEPSSVIFAIQHSGSLRRYGGRMTIRFDSMDDAWLDRTVAWLSERGIASYLLIEDWETGRFRDKFRNQEAVARVDAPPILVYTGAGKISLYDLRASRDPMAPVTEIRETWEGPRCQHAAVMEIPFR